MQLRMQPTLDSTEHAGGRLVFVQGPGGALYLLTGDEDGKLLELTPKPAQVRRVR